MEEENLNKKQQLKKDFFHNNDSLFSKKSKYIPYNLKDSTQILSNIASNKRFSQVRKRYKTMTFLSKILLKSQFQFISYAFTRNDILYIACPNHIAQSELEYQKINILKFCKKSTQFLEIATINIFRDIKFKKPDKNINKNAIKASFAERSYGIFANTLSDPKSRLIVENIRNDIKNIIK